MHLALKLEINKKLVSEANNSDYWTVKMRRRQEVQKALQWAVIEKLGHLQLTTPAIVKLTRIGKKLDSDNLQSAFKSVRDKIADLIIPGKKKGQADSSPLIEWVYHQEPKNGRQEGFVVEIYQEQLQDLSRFA